MARLVIFDEFVRGVDLARQPLILGRSRRADIPIRDRLLSRKHCTIVPVERAAPNASGFRLIDLKSSNGTFVNGVRIEEKDLEFDDIVEIGSTVMVLLATDAWRRGQTLPRLRNLAKAEELMRAIRRREVPAGDSRLAGLAGAGPAAGGLAAGLRQKRVLTEGEAAFMDWARREILLKPALRPLLERYLSCQIVSLLLRHVPELGPALSSAMERLLAPERFGGDAGEFEAALRAALEEALSGGGSSEAGGVREGP